jgi:hypothetical protein
MQIITHNGTPTCIAHELACASSSADIPRQGLWKHVGVEGLSFIGAAVVGKLKAGQPKL